MIKLNAGARAALDSIAGHFIASGAIVVITLHHRLYFVGAGIGILAGVSMFTIAIAVLDRHKPQWRTSMEERPWLPLRQAAEILGIKFKTAQNSISEGMFAVPSYKLGRHRVVDKVVLEKFFELKRTQGLAALEKYTRRR